MDDEMDYDMCPNCITPWKCNGPHLDERDRTWVSDAQPGRSPVSYGRERTDHVAAVNRTIREGLRWARGEA